MPVPGALTDPAVVSGEDVTIPSGDTAVDGYLARPTAPGPRPGVIVIHEAFGLVEHIRDVARRLAGAGFDALAPNLYTRAGSPRPDDMASVMETMFGLPDAQAVADLEAAAAHLRSLDEASGRVGVIGFCSGGRQALLLACSSSAVDAAVDCWGGFIDRATPDAPETPNRPARVVDLVERLSCPVLAVGGVEDQNPSPATLADLESRAHEAGKPLTVKVFEGAGHAFLADYRPSYREGPAHELWPQIVAFLREHLAQP